MSISGNNIHNHHENYSYFNIYGGGTWNDMCVVDLNQNAQADYNGDFYLGNERGEYHKASSLQSMDKNKDDKLDLTELLDSKMVLWRYPDRAFKMPLLRCLGDESYIDLKRWIFKGNNSCIMLPINAEESKKT